MSYTLGRCVGIAEYTILLSEYYLPRRRSFPRYPMRWKYLCLPNPTMRLNTYTCTDTVTLSVYNSQLTQTNGGTRTMFRNIRLLGALFMLPWLLIATFGAHYVQAAT